MRETHDAQSKDSLEVLLDDVGIVVRGQEVAAVAAQRFDLWFTPDPAQYDGGAPWAPRTATPPTRTTTP